MTRRIKPNYAVLAIAALSLTWPISALPSDLSGQFWRVWEESARKVPNLAILTAQGSIGDWFKEQRVPGTNISCCDSADGRVLESDEWDILNGGYVVYHQGQTLVVAENRVLRNSSNPTGGAVAFIRNGVVLCFVPGRLS